MTRLRTFGSRVGYLWTVLWHPIDGIYEIVYKGKGTIPSACFIYGLFYVMVVLRTMVTNFIFNPYGLHGTSLPQIFMINVIPILVFVVGNCLVSSITKGQGTYKAVFISTAYMLAPYIILAVPFSILSNAFSTAEQAIYMFVIWFVKIWTGFFLFLGIMEVHGYNIPEAIVNTLWILFASLMVVVFAAAFYGITYQSINFLYEFFSEAIGYV